MLLPITNSGAREHHSSAARRRTRCRGRAYDESGSDWRVQRQSRDAGKFTVWISGRPVNCAGVLVADPTMRRPLMKRSSRPDRPGPGNGRCAMLTFPLGIGSVSANRVPVRCWPSDGGRHLVRQVIGPFVEVEPLALRRVEGARSRSGRSRRSCGACSGRRGPRCWPTARRRSGRGTRG